MLLRICKNYRFLLVRRFLISLREEGVRRAFSKVRLYMWMQVLGLAPTALRSVGNSDHDLRNPYFQGIWKQLAQGNSFHVSPGDTQNHRPRIAIIGDLNLSQCRKYRVEQLAEFWRAQGVDCDFSHYQDLPRVSRLLAQATHLIEYRLLSNPMTEMLRYEARRLRLPILYDIDDPLFSVSAYATYGNMAVVGENAQTHFLNEAPKFLSMMNGADLISVSTPGLAEHASLYCPRPIYVRRNFADEETLTKGRAAMDAQPKSDGLFRIAFSSGSLGHEADLATILPEVSQFITSADHRRLLILGRFDTSHLPLEMAARIEVIPFTTYEGYLAALARADCAILPLCDDLFNGCKSGVRVIDAASVGVPSIVSSVGDLPHHIRDGKSGYVAHEAKDWLVYFEKLDRNRKHTANLGLTARKHLESTGSAQSTANIIAPELLDWVRA